LFFLKKKKKKKKPFAAKSVKGKTPRA